VGRAEAEGLSWPLPPEVDEGMLEALPFLPKPAVHLSSRLMPNREEVHKELKGKGMTLFFLWRSRMRPIRIATSTAGSARSTGNGKESLI